MAQHDYVIANQSGLEFRQDLNNSLSAIVTNNSGSTQPATTYAGMVWLDTSTSPPVKKIRNQANNAWGGESRQGPDVVVGDFIFDGKLGLGTSGSPNYGTSGMVLTSQGASADPIWSNGPVSYRNILNNSNFRINQRGYVSGNVLAAGAFGHDRWKAGASGGGYTFAQLNSSTQITINSGKSLIQVVEDKNVKGGTYVLSWAGTAQARYGLNTAVPSGAYAASPIIISGQTAGTTISVEFNAGTLSEVQLERGSISSPFEYKLYSEDLIECQRYFEKGTPGRGTNYGAISQRVNVPIYFKVEKRIVPTCTVGAGSVDYPSTTVFGCYQTAVTPGAEFNPISYTASADL